MEEHFGNEQIYYVHPKLYSGIFVLITIKGFSIFIKKVVIHEQYNKVSSEVIINNLNHNECNLTAELFSGFSENDSVGDTFFRTNGSVKVAITRIQ